MGERSDSGWVGYQGDRHGRPTAAGNDHLTAEQRELLQQQGDERAAARGRHQVRVVVDVYENGEAAPQVQFPGGSTIDIGDRAQVNACVAKAAEALANWR
jgi:hypothetical protein